MSKIGPIVLIEDDLDDQLLIREVLTMLRVKNSFVQLRDGQEALDYLRTTTEVPFIILCDINMPRINGLQLRSVIGSSETLKKKSIPFIFFSTTADQPSVEKAYDMTVQGYFQKGSNFSELSRQLKLIVDYWMECKHPNLYPSLAAI